MNSLGTFKYRRNLENASLVSLADNTLSSESDVLDNTKNKDSYVILEIILGSLTPTGTPYLEIYMVKSLDELNYEDAPVIGGDNVNTIFTTVPVKTGAAVKRIMTGILFIPPLKLKFYVGNQLNVTTASSGNKINVYTSK